MGTKIEEKSTETVRLRVEGRAGRFGAPPRGRVDTVVSGCAATSGRRRTEERGRGDPESASEVRGRRQSVRDPRERVEEAQVGFAALAMAAVLTAVVVIVLFGTAHARAAVVDGVDRSGSATAVDTVHAHRVPDAIPR